MNKRDLSIGSIVYNIQMNVVVEVVELYKKKARIVGQIKSGKYVTPFELEQDYDLIEGVEINEDSLQKIGFVWIEDRHRHLAYYFADMKLTYRYDKRNRISRFIFTDFKKTYTRISCEYIHELQNIMRFLTGSELEFKYNHNEQTV